MNELNPMLRGLDLGTNTRGRFGRESKKTFPSRAETDFKTKNITAAKNNDTLK